MAHLRGSSPPAPLPSLAVAKALADSARETKVLEIRGGVMQGREISASDVQELAKLYLFYPSLHTLPPTIVGVREASRPHTPAAGTLISASQPSGARMRLLVLPAQAAGIDPGVNLGCGDGRMTE